MNLAEDIFSKNHFYRNNFSENCEIRKKSAEVIFFPVVFRRHHVLNDPVNLIDPLGLSQAEVDAAMSWLRESHPELFRNNNPRARDVNLPGDTSGLTLPGYILIDTSSANGNMGEIVDSVAHELMHSQRGFFNTILFQTEAEHDSIYQDAYRIRQEYENRSRGGQCPM